MNKILKYIVVIVFVVVVLLQVFGPEAPENREANPDDLIATAELSGDVADLMKAACYDCHSMETKYPWYASVAPFSGLIFEHIEEGREELNFSNWASMEKRTKLRKLKEIQEEVEERKMPVDSYTWIHAEADLSDEQREMIISWANSYAKEVLKQ